MPYLSADLPGIGGAIKQRPEDFRVTERPLYEPSGEGTHTYFGLRKRGIPTPAAVGQLARRLGVAPGEIGVAGLKDAQALTEQTMSVEHVEPARLEGLRDDHWEVTWVSRHTNKLRRGHLSANAFAIRIRDVSRGQIEPARAVFERLVARGVPNLYGPQRFGRAGQNATLGQAIVAGDLEGFIRRMLGSPSPEDPPDVAAARALFDSGQADKALRRWPGHYFNERRALRAWVRTGKPKPAFAALDKFTKRFLVSAFQSDLFNRVLARRIDSLHTVAAGDLAQKHDSGGVFLVEDVAAEAPRAERFEISPTGPLFGYRVRLAEGEPGQLEQAVLDEAQLTLEDWRKTGGQKVKGARRSLRYPLGEPAIEADADRHGSYIEVRFTAPAGCYATALLREIMKDDEAAAAADETTAREVED